MYQSDGILLPGTSVHGTHNMSALHWCFTYNNPQHEAEGIMDALKPMANYVVFQKEVGKSGTEHFQGYVEFKTRKRLTQVRKLLSCHWEKRMGKRDQARDYCMKEEGRLEGPWESDTWIPVAQGKRSDLAAVYQMARDGKTHLEIADAHPETYMKYHKAISQVKHIHSMDKPGIRDLKVYIFYGPPGTGKTRTAYKDDPNLYAIPVGKDLWFDNYNGEKTVLLDDFSGQMRLVDLLRVLDIYPVQLPRKGGFVWLQAETIIITTNVHPENWYDYSSRKDSKEALKRRITSSLEFTAIDEEPEALLW